MPAFTSASASASAVRDRVKLLCDYAGFSTRVKRQEITLRLGWVLRDAREDGLINTAEWCALDAIVYGLAWYVQTGRATVEIAQALDGLSGRKFLALVCCMELEGVAVSGDVGPWLRANLHRLK